MRMGRVGEAGCRIDLREDISLIEVSCAAVPCPPIQIVRAIDSDRISVRVKAVARTSGVLLTGVRIATSSLLVVYLIAE